MISESQNHENSLLEEFDPDKITSIEEYSPYVSIQLIEELKRIADPLEGAGFTNINSTMIGGGVAEMLRSLIPIARGMGIQANWRAIQGSGNFFEVTKKFHNMLQGAEGEISLEEIFGAYLDTINENTKNTLIASDLVVVHDPQPAALIMNGVIYGNVLWRCHIDTSHPNMIVWRFLLPYINLCSGAIFTMPEYVGPGVQVPIYEINPCIDPLSPKNRQYTEVEAKDILSPIFNKFNIDPDRPIIAAVSRYDIHKNQSSIIKAFKLFQERFVNEETPGSVKPYMIFLGNTASDDPEGEEVLSKLKEIADDNPDIIFLKNVEDNDRVVGSLMRFAKLFIHVSTREGFGLVVSEAMWQGTPVMGSSVGGITKQIHDQKNGYLVQPDEIEKMAYYMNHVLTHPDEGAGLGRLAQETVKENFLLPQLLRRYLRLLSFYSGKNPVFPSFRLDNLSYSEIICAIRSKHLTLPLKRN